MNPAWEATTFERTFHGWKIMVWRTTDRGTIDRGGAYFWLFALRHNGRMPAVYSHKMMKHFKTAGQARAAAIDTIKTTKNLKPEKQ